MSSAHFQGSATEVVARDLRFPEGPVALDDGSVLVVEIEGGAITTLEASGSRQSIACGGGPNGAAFGPDGALYVCNDGGLAFKTEDGIRFPFDGAPGNEGGYVQRADLSTGEVAVVFSEVDGLRIGSLNDIVFDETGSCYIVDTTRGVIYYADPLDASIRMAEHALDMPNGMGLSPDGSRLYVSETYTGRIWAWDVMGPGRLAGRREHYSSAGAHGWDGLAVDGAGHVCAANLERSGITVVDEGGKLVGAFVTPTPDPYVTNICFGLDKAYICSSGRGLLYSVDWPWPGLRLHFAR